MASSKYTNQVHKCVSEVSISSSANFCSICGVFMSRGFDQPKYLRSNKYRVAEPFKIDPNVTLDEMKKKQHLNRYFRPLAPFVKYRTELLAFLKYITGKMGYSQKTFNLAIGVLDAFLCQNELSSSQLKFACFMALHMSAKMEENYNKTPDSNVIRRLFEDKVTSDDIRNYEVAICKSVGFNFEIKTPFCFVEHFLTKGIINDKELKTGCNFEIEDELELFECEVLNFLSLSTKYYEFNGYPPVIVAAAAILCARKSLDYANKWSFDLEQLTTVRLVDVLGCSKSLYKIYKTEAGLTSKKNKGDSAFTKLSNGTKSGSSIETMDSDHLASEISDDRKRFSAHSIAMDIEEEIPIKNSTVYNTLRRC